MSASEDGQLALLDGGHRPVNPSIFAHLEEGLRSKPNDPALIVPHQPSNHLAELVNPRHEKALHNHHCLTWTFDELHRASLKLVKGLLANGVKPGMTIATFIDNGSEYTLLLWSCALLKVTLAGLDMGALLKPRSEELENFLVTLRPDVVIVPDLDGAAAIDKATQVVDIHPRLRVLLEGRQTPPWHSFVDIGTTGDVHELDEQALLSSARKDDLTRTAFVLFTSGTSAGKPKGCPQHVAIHSFHLDSRPWGIQDGHPHVLVTSANFRVIAPSRMMASWKQGAAVVLLTSSSPPSVILDALEKYRISSLILIPAALHALVADPSFGSRDISSIRSVMLGGDMITKNLMQKAAASFPDAEVAVGHGMTEGGSLYFWPYTRSTFSEIPFFGEIAPLGVINQGARIKICDNDGDRVVKRGEPGEIHASSPGLIYRYLGDVNAEAFYIDDEGRQWFRTGDLGMINGEGVVYVLGRIKDVIKRAGVPITPAALESSISTFTGAQTSVLAVASPLGQEPFAVLETFNSKTEAQIKQRVLELFGRDYAIHSAVTLEQLGLDAFPLNATGKVMKIELLKSVEQFLRSRGEEKNVS